MAKRMAVVDLMTPAPMVPIPSPTPTAKMVKNPREGWSVAQFRFRPDTWKGLRQIALDRDENVQILVEKALSHYLKARGIKTARLALRSDAEEGAAK